jgi:hypothetical protein
MMQTKQQDVTGSVVAGALQAALDTVDSSSELSLKKHDKTRVGDGTPGPGRPKGVANRVTRTIREAVEKAAQDCHADGLAGWLIERAQGGIQDRQIFAQMVNKAMPLQVHANVDGGIKLELSWLSARSIGATTAQIAEQRTQVIDLQPETDGTYRIREQTPAPPAGNAAGPADAGTPPAGHTGAGSAGKG